MKKLKSIISILLCALILTALPAVRSAAYEGSVYINDRENVAAALGITDRQLTELVELIRDSVASCLPLIVISSYNIPFNADTISILTDLLTDNPKAFNIDLSNTKFAYYGPVFHSIRMAYLTDVEEFNAQLAECDAVAAKLTKGLAGLPEAIKVALIHDRLAAYCSYSEEYNDVDYTAYGALVNRKAVCQGYTFGFGYLLDYVGIGNYFCISDDLNHIWNIVIVDGEKYHVDVTWDDPLFDILGRVIHSNLLVSSERLFGAPSTHAAYDYDSSPDSTTYDDYFWSGLNTQICLVNGTLYYMNNAAGCICSYDYVTGVSRPIYDLSSVRWPAGPMSNWRGNYTYLDSDGKYLLFSLPDGIYRLDPVTRQGEAVFLPDMSAYDYFSVYGFDLCDGVITCLAAYSPNIGPDTAKEYYTCYYEEYEPSAPVVENVEQGGVYQGSVTISWDVGTATLDGAPFENGAAVTEPGEHTLVIVNEDKTTTLTFTVEPAAEPPQQKGDIDGDGVITVADALSVLRVAARLAPATPDILALGDVDGDGVITVADALAILRVAAKLASGL